MSAFAGRFTQRVLFKQALVGTAAFTAMAVRSGFAVIIFWAILSLPALRRDPAPFARRDLGLAVTAAFVVTTLFLVATDLFVVTALFLVVTAFNLVATALFLFVIRLALANVITPLVSTFVLTTLFSVVAATRGHDASFLLNTVTTRGRRR